MNDTAMLEQRLTVLEHAFADLQTHLNGSSGSSNWLDRVTGSITDEAAFLEALRLGREFRNADRPSDESDESS